MRFFWIVLLGFAAGCASGPQFSEENMGPQALGKGSIYIYRNSSFVGVIQRPDVIVDGKKSFELVSGGYRLLKLEPGVHRIELTQMGEVFVSTEFETKPNETHFLRYEIAENSYVNRWSEGFESNPAETVRKFSLHKFDRPDAVLFQNVKTRFNPRLFFLKRELALKELKSTHLIK